MKIIFRALLMGLVLIGVVAVPAATASSTADCKDGGYASWRPAAGEEPFKNQGQCVSFVARGGTLVPLAVPFGCTSSRTPNGDVDGTDTVLARCVGVTELTVEGFFDVWYGEVQPDGSHVVTRPDVSCWDHVRVIAHSASGYEYYQEYPSDCPPPAPFECTSSRTPNGDGTDTDTVLASCVGASVLTVYANGFAWYVEVQPDGSHVFTQSDVSCSLNVSVIAYQASGGGRYQANFSPDCPAP